MKWADWEKLLNQVVTYVVSLPSAFSARAKEAQEEDGSAMNDKGWYEGKNKLRLEGEKE